MGLPKIYGKEKEAFQSNWATLFVQFFDKRCQNMRINF